MSLSLVGPVIQSTASPVLPRVVDTQATLSDGERK
jgi:hypothetical protein